MLEMKQMEAYLPVLDSYFSIVLFGPLVAAYWRGTWGLADIYLYPDNHILSLCVSTVGGIAIYFIYMALQSVAAQMNYKMSPLVFYLSSRFHLYILGHACVNYWRGFMGFMDMSGNTFLSAGIMTGGATLMLMLLKGTCNGVSAPLYTIPDRGPLGRQDFYQITTRFKTKPGFTVRFLADCCFSVFIMIGLVIVQWQGIWSLIDLLIVPYDKLYSSWLSVIIGYCLTAILFLVQLPLMIICKQIKRNDVQNKSFYFLIFIEDIMNVAGTTASAFVWRGIWNLQDQLLLVDNKELSLWVSHGVGVVCLMVMFHFNTVIQAGLSVDGETVLSEQKTFYDIKFITNIIDYSGDMTQLSMKDERADIETTNGVRRGPEPVKITETL